MLCVHYNNALNYALCNQTVTVYHQDGDQYQRTIYHNAYLDYRKNHNVDKTGSRESNSFLLVIPGENVCLYAKDKVILGAGRVISNREEWAKFIPANVPGLVVIQYVDPKYFNGHQCHVEAGG